MDEITKNLVQELESLAADESAEPVIRLLAGRAADKIEGLEADLILAVSTAYRRGAREWTRLNYPEYFKRLEVQK